MAEAAQTREGLNVLYSTHTSLGYMPPLEVSPRQIIVGPDYKSVTQDGLIRAINVRPGEYDLGHLVASLPAGQKPDLTIVIADSFQMCVPRNLAAVPGRKLLLAADTHHGQAPLRKVIAYAQSEPFDRIAVIHDPHHLHWIAEAGIAPATYIPNVNVQHHPTVFATVRQPVIAFIGRVGAFHPRRSALIEHMQRMGVPLRVQTAQTADAANIFATSQISFNCSLNADLNMRVFEVLAAGGFLLTDRLSAQANLEGFFIPGQDYADYDSPADLIAKVKYFLARPEECLRIAHSGQAKYLEHHSPDQRREDLIRYAFSDAPPPVPHDRRALSDGTGFGADLSDRVIIYEFIQELTRTNESISVVVDAGVGPRLVSDLADLPRLNITVQESPGSDPMFSETLADLGVTLAASRNTVQPCDILIGGEGIKADPLFSAASSAKAVVLFGGEETCQAAGARLQGLGFQRTPTSPSLSFWRRAS
ncbi:MAG: glycosyltransferase [Xanthobacteraceae bacterium]|nr:glycosyltransferase [Xanthobacteraceae bacterium]